MKTFSNYYQKTIIRNMEAEYWLKKHTECSNSNNVRSVQHISIISIQPFLLVITIKALWKLVHLETPIYGYTLLAFKTSKSAQVTASVKKAINMDEDWGLKKYTECSIPANQCKYNIHVLSSCIMSSWSWS